MTSYLFTPAQLFETEANRKIKKEPALAMDIPKSFVSFPTSVMKATVRSEEDGEPEVQQQRNVDVVGELWSFA